MVSSASKGFGLSRSRPLLLGLGLKRVFRIEDLYGPCVQPYIFLHTTYIPDKP